MKGLEKEWYNVRAVTAKGTKESAEGEEAQAQTVEAAMVDLPTSGVESIVNDVDESSLVNVPSN